MQKYKSLVSTIRPPFLFFSQQMVKLPKGIFYKFNQGDSRPSTQLDTLSLNHCYHQSKPKRKVVAQICDTAKDIKSLYRLRYTIFTQEYGAKIKSLRKIDKNIFDRYCKHVIVRDTNNNKIIGYTRIMTYEANLKLGKFYTQGEFCLSSLASYLPRSAEIGRTCIHPDYRNGATIAVLWSKVAEYLALHKIQYLFGCASLGLGDSGKNASAVIAKLKKQGAFDPTLNVSPKQPLGYELQDNIQETDCVVPPLLKAYVRMGARLAPEPHWDKSFNVADLFIFLDLDKTNTRYLKHFMRDAA